MATVGIPLLESRVTLQAPVIDRTGDGAAVESFVDVSGIWARRRDLRGREYIAADQQTIAEADATFTIRHRADVTVRHRIVAGGLVYDILHIAETMRGRWLELTVQARVTP
jgi:SPP1 family predicted phage head-tail adaptor